MNATKIIAAPAPPNAILMLFDFPVNGVTDAALVGTGKLRGAFSDLVAVLVNGVLRLVVVKVSTVVTDLVGNALRDGLTLFVVAAAVTEA